MSQFRVSMLVKSIPALSQSPVHTSPANSLVFPGGGTTWLLANPVNFLFIGFHCIELYSNISSAFRLQYLRRGRKVDGEEKNMRSLLVMHKGYWLQTNSLGHILSTLRLSVNQFCPVQWRWLWIEAPRKSVREGHRCSTTSWGGQRH